MAHDALSHANWQGIYATRTMISQKFMNTSVQVDVQKTNPQTVDPENCGATEVQVAPDIASRRN